MALMAGFGAAAQEQVTLSFNRGGTDAASVTVNTDGAAGVSATLTAATPAFKPTAGSVTSAILCPNVNGNANANISMTFSVAGLPEGVTITNVGLDIHALNGANNYQEHSDGQPRQWNVGLTLGGENFGSLSDVDIAAGVNPEGTRHKVWDVTPATPYKVSGSSVELNLNVTSGTTNSGCFFGLSDVVITYESGSGSDTAESYYAIFEANFKEGIGDWGSFKFGSYLCNSELPLGGIKGESNLNGSDSRTFHCVFEVTPGSEAGAYYVRNLFSNTYLVILGECSQMSETPVNIWFHDFSWEGKSGVQICTGSTIDNNCLQSSTVDRTTGCGADNKSTLWTIEKLNATTLEELYEMFDFDPNALTEADLSAYWDKQHAELIELVNAYKASVPFLTSTSYISKVTSQTYAWVGQYMGYTSFEEIDGFFANYISNVENGLLNDLNNNVDKYWTLYQPGQGAYLCSTPKSTNKGWDSFNYQALDDVKAAWHVEKAADNKIYLRSAAYTYIGTPEQHYCKVVNSADEAGAFTLGIKDGYVTFNSVDHAGAALGLDGKNDPAEIMSLQDGSNGYRWKVALYTGEEPQEPHTYMYFEAYRKTSDNNVWGSYLQDANEAITGSSVYNKTSTLCGSDELNINCVWEITPGTEDGAYHVQNFVTKKYLVNLIAYGSTTLDEPVNIWFHDLTRDGNTGIQIGTGATVNNNCLDQDNCDRLVGMWANDNGNLWFPTTMDATTPEEVRAFFAAAGPTEQEKINAFNARVDQIAAWCELYKQNVNCVSDASVALMEQVASFKADAASHVAGCASVEEVEAEADKLALDPVEASILGDLNAVATTNAWVFGNKAKSGYLSSSVYDNNIDCFIVQPESNAGAMWALVATDQENVFTLKALNTGAQVYASKISSVGGECGLASDIHGKTLTVSFGLKDGYAQLVANVPDGAVGFDTKDYLKVVSNEEEGSLWTVTTVTAPEFAEAFAQQLAAWGVNIPDGSAVAEKAATDIKAASDLASMSELGVQARKDLVKTLCTGTSSVAIKNAANGEYLTYDFGLYTIAEQTSASAWKFNADSSYDSETDPRYFIYNESSKSNITIANGNLTLATSGSSLNFVVMLDNSGYIMFRCGNVGTAPYLNYALGVNEDSEVVYTAENTVHNGTNNYFWSVEKTGTPEDPRYAVIREKLAAAKALCEQYAESVPFCSGLDDAIITIDSFSPQMIIMLGQYEQIDAFLNMMVLDAVRATVLAALKENVDKPWTLYQPGQAAYLSANAKDTNKGWASFNYQSDVNVDSYWYVVPTATEDVYVLKSSNGEYVGTPEVHYCRVETSEAEAGKFTLGLKDGFVTFNSVSHDGCGLGLDGKNDPAEIMSLEDGSLGYRWQVDLYTGDIKDGINEVAAELTDDAVIYDLQGRRVKNVRSGLYIVNGVKTLIRK